MRQTTQENYRTKSKMTMLQMALEERKRKRQERKEMATLKAAASQATVGLMIKE